MAQLQIWKSGNCRELEFEPPMALHLLLEQAGFAGMRPCGGRGKCGKCAVMVSGTVSAPNGAERAAGIRLACQVQILGDAQVFLPEESAMEQIQMDSAATITLDQNKGTGAAVDIGTTTVVLRRYDLETGAVLGQAAVVNPQTSVAADVMGRIGAAMNGRLSMQRDQITHALALLLNQAGGPVDRMIVTGNTTMLYLLTGRDPSCLSCAPFEADTLFDTARTLLDTPAWLPPCMNAFVGADITCAVLASGMCRGGTALLCDVGTNGEVALWKDGVLYVTSTAAGPAFEGAGISCGCGSVPGAIDKVWAENGRLCIHTIGEKPAVGICGSGLIDAAAVLLQEEQMDETGAMDDDEVMLAPGVALLQKDIRAMQLAKAAIAAGIATLLEASNTTCDQIGTFYLAGGFGSHLNIESAAAIGLFPAELMEKTVVLGNAALAGAAQALLNQEACGEIRRIASLSRHYNLGGNPTFNQLYMEHMLFPFEY